MFRSESGDGDALTSSASTPLQSVMSAMQSAADAFVQLAPGELADGALSELIAQVDHAQNQIDAARTRVVGVFDARTVWALDGAGSGGSWLASHTELSRHTGQRQVRDARRLRTMPVAEEAALAGDLGSAKVNLLGEAAAFAPEAYGRDESWLVSNTVGLRVDETVKFLARWRHMVAPTDAAERAEKQRHDRAVHLSQTFENTWRLDGTLDPESGEIINNALSRLVRQYYRSDRAAADATGDPVTRTAPQRRADALVDLARQLLANSDGVVATGVPLLVAHVDANKVCDPTTGPHDLVGETEAGTPLTATTARRLACDGALARITTAGGSVPVNLGTTERLPSPAMRRAIRHRDQGCVFPGCDRSPDWCQAHHITHWADGGPTDIENLASLCSHHHHLVHEGGFKLRRLPSGLLEFQRPDGSTIDVPKHRTHHSTWSQAA